MKSVSIYFGIKQLGIIVIVISILLAIFMIFYTLDIMETEDVQCGEVCGVNMGADCPHKGNIPIQSYFGFTIVSILGIVGYSITNSSKKIEQTITEKKSNIEKIVKMLRKDEKDIYEMINKADGALLQSELVEKSNLNKVKVTRILDKLEGRGLIERQRRGMTNIVLLKR